MAIGTAFDAAGFSRWPRRQNAAANRNVMRIGDCVAAAIDRARGGHIFSAICLRSRRPARQRADAIAA